MQRFIQYRCLSHRAMILRATGSAQGLTEATREPRAPSERELKVRVHCCGVSSLDVMNRKGAFPFIKTPIILGHEVSGVVVEVGSGCSSNIAVGDKVLSLHWDQASSWPSPLTSSGPTKSILGLLEDGGNQEFMTAAEHTFMKFESKQEWSAAQAALIVSTYGTVWQAAILRGNLQPKSTVLVTGASGGVGSAAIQILKHMDCKVIAVTSSPAKVPYLESLGADLVITNIVDFNRHASVQGGVDMVIECTGGPTFLPSMRSLKSQGKLILIGSLAGHFAKLPLGLTILNSLNIIGSDSVSHDVVPDVIAFLDKFEIKPSIQAIMPLESVAEAHLDLERKQVQGRIVLQVADSDW